MEDTVSIKEYKSGSTIRFKLSQNIISTLSLSKDDVVDVKINQLYRDGELLKDFAENQLPMVGNVIQVGSSFYITVSQDVRKVLSLRKDDVLAINVEKMEL